ncbi:MAG TPA: sulfatase [Bryobacteraceae bacterium]|nr:sulfatase [Bryobacteraceae bacterium]
MPITRRQSLKAVAGAALASSACSRPKSRPNILYIMTDDHVPGAMSCYGNRILQTPSLDRLANEGFRFNNCFVTNSLCAPGRASVLTGCLSNIHHIYGNSEGRDAIEKMTPGIPTYPKLLQQAGYRTALIGKWHLSDDPAGFDYWNVLPGQGLYFDPEFIEMGARRKYPGYVTDVTTEMALKFLKEAGREKPWCLVYQHKAPHRPFKPAPRHAGMFSDIELPYPETFDDNYDTRRLAKEAEDMRFDISLAGDYKDMPKDLSPADRKKWLYQRFVKDYYRAVYGVDENLARLLKHLDDTGQAENTLILYSSDNGFFLGEHGWYDKRFMYEPSLRVPLLVRYPGLGGGGKALDQMVQNIDFAPTILDFAGVAIPDSMQGRSIRPLLEGKAPAGWRSSVYYAYFENSWTLRGKSKEEMSDPTFQYFTPHRVSPHRGVRTDRYKLIEYYSEGDYWELFDLKEDPNELKNLYGAPASAQITAGLKQELSRLRAQYKDT